MNLDANDASPVSLQATTTAIDALTFDEMIEYTSSSSPLLWWNNGSGMIGAGQTLRLTFTGPARFRDASASWRAVAERSTVIDHVHAPGTGLTAFGTFAFADGSARPSTLVVPRWIVGRTGGRSWVTSITAVKGSPEDVVIEATGAAPGRAGLGSSAALPPASALGPAPTVSFAEGAMTRASFTNAVEDALRTIGARSAEKVVLARDLVGEWSPSFDLRATLTALAQTYAGCWTYAVEGMFGSSPETLVTVHDGVFHSRVLAGTTGRILGDDDSDDSAARALLGSAKERSEHAFAVASARDAVAEIVESLAVSAEPFALRLPNLWHLASELTGELPESASSLDLVAALHPTAAVAGTPRQAALAIIDRLEPFDRGGYAAPIGWIDADGNGEWAVGVRSAQLSSGAAGTRTITAHAGCGVVAGSIAGHELDETRLKFKPILDALRSPAAETR